MKVWIDQDLCTGDGLCEEICPSIFFGHDDGLYYVKEVDSPNPDLGSDGRPNKQMAEGTANVPDKLIGDVIEAAEECPGECIFITES